MTNLIELKAVNKTYMMGEIAVHALQDINLSIGHGEYVAILGPSGSGKSTLMNVLGCLDKPSSGQYLLEEQDVGRLKRPQLSQIRNHKIGFIFQSFNLLNYATAIDNVALPLVFRGTNARERKQRAAAMLTKVGLGNRLTHKPNELSGGQRQRVAIARALVTEPDVLLADEPTGNLDSQSGSEIKTIFEDLAASGKTVILVTHDEKLAQCTGRILTISDGKLVADSKAS
jgi:putative ABC transport system ATP-binding protein